MKTIDLVYFNAGGGHRAAALALQQVISAQRRPWCVRLVDLSRLLDPEARFRRLFGFEPEALYNQRLRRGWTLGMAQELKLLQAGIRIAHAPMRRVLVQHWAKAEPDVVVSLVPNFNRVLVESVATALPGAPFLTVLTDLADHPPHFWIEPDLPQRIVCGTAHAVRQARAMGYAAKDIDLTSGMVLKPAFHDLPRLDRAAARLDAGLDPERPTAVVAFGGYGSRRMLDIAKALPDLQLVLLCGRNEGLAQELRALRRRSPHAVVGYSDDIAGWMRLGDLFIGKPGPGSLSEAVHLELPVITLRNAWTLPQERFNTDWVHEHGLGVVLGSWSQLPGAMRRVVDGLPAFKLATRAMANRAVFEVPELIADALVTTASAGARLDQRRPALASSA